VFKSWFARGISSAVFAVSALALSASAAEATPCADGEDAQGAVTSITANWSGLHAGRAPAQRGVTVHVTGVCDVQTVSLEYSGYDGPNSVELTPLAGSEESLEDADWTGVLALDYPGRYTVDGIVVDGSAPQGTPRTFTVAMDSSVTAARSSSTGNYGQAVTITGEATQYPGDEIDESWQRAPLHLWARKHGASKWYDQGYLWSNGGGEAAFRPVPAAWTDYQVRVPAYGGRTAAASKVVSVNVRPRVTAAFTRTSIKRGTYTHLSGTVAPSHRGQTVSLMWRSPTGWRAVAKATLSSTSAYRFTLKGSSRGTRAYQVVKPADSDHAASWSPIQVITIR